MAVRQLGTPPPSGRAAIAPSRPPGRPHERRAAVVLGILAALGSAPGLSAQDPPDLGPANRGKPPVRAATEALTGARGIGLPVPGALNEGKPVPASVNAVWAARLPNLGAPKRRETTALWLFVGATGSRFPNLESTACDQLGLTSCRADAFGLGPVLGVRVRPFGGIPLAVGLRGGRSAVSVRQAFSGPPFPDASDIELDVWSVTAHVGAWIPVGARTRLSASAGWGWSWNRARVTSTFGTETLVEHRRDSGGRYTLGAGVERDVTDRLVIRAEYRFIDGDSGDADRRHQVGVLLGWRVWRR